MCAVVFNNHITANLRLNVGKYFMNLQQNLGGLLFWTTLYF